MKRTRTKGTMALLADDDESFTNLAKVSLIFAKHLFCKQEYKENNVVFSPLSLQVVLSIITAGSEGPTRQQLLNFLRFKSTDHLNSFVSHLLSFLLKEATPSRRPCKPFFGPAAPATPAGLSFTNGVWFDQTLSVQPSFKEIVSSHYKATLSTVDFITNAFEVTKEVNLWAEKETNGLIKEILPQESVNSLTRLIFANSLYFKGAWNVPFPNSRTNNYDFHLLNGSSVKVPFMSNNLDQIIGAFDGFKVLRLPYEQGEDKRKFSMYVFLPNAKDGLPALVEKVSSEFELLEQNLPLIPRRVGGFRIPKFKFSFGLETSDALKELGVILPFHGGLTKMVDSCDDKDLFVSNFFHKCFIEVNEEGTVAAAASAARVAMCIPKGIDFIADHPFLFLIREDSTRTIAFAGQVLNPLVG